jgi:hypothetical protein
LIFGFGKNWGGEKSTVKIVDAEFDVGEEVKEEVKLSGKLVCQYYRQKGN